MLWGKVSSKCNKIIENQQIIAKHSCTILSVFDVGAWCFDVEISFRLHYMYKQKTICNVELAFVRQFGTHCMCKIVLCCCCNSKFEFDPSMGWYAYWTLAVSRMQQQQLIYCKSNLQIESDSHCLCMYSFTVVCDTRGTDDWANNIKIDCILLSRFNCVQLHAKLVCVLCHLSTDQ